MDDTLSSQASFAPLVALVPCSLADANAYLTAWGHRMGPLVRGNQGAWCHVLLHDAEPVAVATTSYLIAANVGGGEAWLTRTNCCELSRLCAVRSGLNRVMLRLWREFVFPSLGFPFAISYQDAMLHSGNTYRFDGWHRIAYSTSGTDTRSGREGRKKYVWLWPPTEAKDAI